MYELLRISGGPRKKDNTTYAVRYALDFLNKELFKTRFISLTNKKISLVLAAGSV